MTRLQTKNFNILIDQCTIIAQALDIVLILKPSYSFLTETILKDEFTLGFKTRDSQYGDWINFHGRDLKTIDSRAVLLERVGALILRVAVQFKTRIL